MRRKLMPGNVKNLEKLLRIYDFGFMISDLGLSFFIYFPINKNVMTSEELKNRTKKHALAIIKLANDLPNNRVGWTFTDQIVRSSTSVAANYRAACRAKSDKDFISKMETVIEETDETLFWLEMIDESDILIVKQPINPLAKETNELLSIFVASVKTVKNRLNAAK
jgi:four helix bundle protein